jgi:hypothetical protein
MTLLPKIFPRNDDQRRADSYREILHREAKIGGQLFGPIPTGHRREFFCLDKHTWVWHEEWTDTQGIPQVVTTRYDVRPDGILKSQGNNSYQQLSGAETRNLLNATRLYRERVVADLNHLLQTA